MGDGGAHEVGVEEVIEGLVGDELATTTDERGVLATQHGVAQDRGTRLAGGAPGRNDFAHRCNSPVSST